MKWWDTIPMESCLVSKDIDSGIVWFRYYDDRTMTFHLYEVDLFSDEVIEREEDETSV